MKEEDPPGKIVPRERPSPAAVATSQKQPPASSNGKDDAAPPGAQDKDLARRGTIWPYDPRNPITAPESTGDQL
jgi:hypothetical protein